MQCSHTRIHIDTETFNYSNFIGRVPGCLDIQWNTVVFPPWCGLCALFQLLRSTDILGGAYSVPYGVIQ